MELTLSERKLVNALRGETEQQTAEQIAETLGKKTLSSYDKALLKVLQARGIIVIESIPVAYRYEYKLTDKVKQRLQGAK